MLHADRIWVMAEVNSAAELATRLSEQTWCLCQAFANKGHPFYR